MGKILPNRVRQRHLRMTLRHGPLVEAMVKETYPSVHQMMLNTIERAGGQIIPGEITAAARYLARALSEFACSKRNGVPDAKYTPFDEAVWREDRALAGEANCSARLTLAVSKARKQRELALASIGLTPSSMGGARKALANAIRHAWLVCHTGCNVSYGRQKRLVDGLQVPAGALHDFVRSVIDLTGVNISVDDLHRDIQKLDKQLHPWAYAKVP
jgi:hypothetical protein